MAGFGFSFVNEILSACTIHFNGSYSFRSLNASSRNTHSKDAAFEFVKFLMKMVVHSTIFYEMPHNNGLSGI